MFNNFQRILCLAPHADDAEISSGGTISRFLREGKEVFVIVFSEAFDDREHTKLGELYRAMEELSVPKKNLFVYNFKDRELSKDRQDILDIMVEIKKIIEPDLILLPSPEDMHQDHQVVAQEGLRAFKDISIWGYEYPWNLLVFKTTCFVKLEEEDLEKKIKALAQYKSQQYREYFNPEVIKGWALTRGIACKSRYAESFEVLRLLI